MSAGPALKPDGAATAHSARALRPRMMRLIPVSAVALGVIFWLAVAGDATGSVAVLLGAGWATMPLVLALSLRHGWLRYLLAIPASLVGGGLVLLFASLTGPWLERAGWLLVTAGVWFGALLGTWFWYGILPVPPRLAAPESGGRWVLIAIHALLVVVGVCFVFVTTVA